jgi:hypothetical protein
MTGFDEREKAFERKFEHDQELAFKIRVLERRLLGLWAAARLGLAGAAAEAYAGELATTGLAHHGNEAAVARILRDFAAKGVAHDAVQVQLELERCEREARQHLGAAR